jgi:hypothetical protein
MAARRTTAAATSQGTLDQGMVPLPPDEVEAANADANVARLGYLDAIEAAGRSLVALRDSAPAEDDDDIRRVIAILRSVYRRQRSRTGSVL